MSMTHSPKSLLRQALLFAAGAVTGAGIAMKANAGRPPGDKPKTEDPKKEAAAADLKETAKWLLGGFALLTATLTTLGAAQGGFERLLRNYTEVAIVSLGLGVISIALAAAAFLWTTLRRPRLLVASLILFTLALLMGVSAAVLTPSTREQPFVSAKITSSATGTILQATVKAAGLRSDENLRIVIHQLVVDAEGYETQGNPLYEADIGPDPGGKVDTVIEIPVEPERYTAVDVVAGIAGNLGATCFDPNPEAGCLVVNLPRPTPSPSPSPSPPEAQAEG
jgi:hypothetical protein